MFAEKVKRCVNFILVLCILFSGICFDVSKADAVILHAAKQEAHVLDSVGILSVNRDICTNEQIGARTINSASMQEARVGGRRISGRIVAVQMAHIPLTDLSMFISETLLTQVEVDNACNSTLIVGYIHNKDGKKA